LYVGSLPLNSCARWFIARIIFLNRFINNTTFVIYSYIAFESAWLTKTLDPHGWTAKRLLIAVKGSEHHHRSRDVYAQENPWS